MLWFIYALLCAFSLATADAFSKKTLEASGAYLIAWVRWAYAFPFLLLTLPFISIPQLDSTFFGVTLILLPLEITTAVLYVKAIKDSPLSLTIPFLATTPVFTILTSFLILEELPDRSGTSGIILIGMGAYLLNVHTGKAGILAPIKAIKRERGSVLMLIVAFIFSITSNLGKVAIQHSSPAFFALCYDALLSVVIFPLVLLREKPGFSGFILKGRAFLVIGFFYALMIIFHNLAITLVEVPYMISVKRTSLIFSVLYGAVLFKEAYIKERIIGSMVMVAGVILITLF
ncbi:MAG: DMT family transporter [bacterium]